MMMKHLPTPAGQGGHSPQRHTAAGTATPTTTDDTGNTVPQRANPIHLQAVARPEAVGLRK